MRLDACDDFLELQVRGEAALATLVTLRQGLVVVPSSLLQFTLDQPFSQAVTGPAVAARAPDPRFGG